MMIGAVMPPVATTHATAIESVSPFLVTFGLPILAVALSPLTAWITFQLVKRRELAESLRIEVERLELVKKPELAETLRYELLREERLAAIREEGARRDRVRQETLRWAAPILGAVDDLRGRLDNILHRFGYPALDANWQPPGGWSITHQYFMTSTLYLFSLYFGYTQLLRQSLSFELFRSQQEKDQLFGALDSVASALASYPPPWRVEGTDEQVFRLQQRSIGELMMVRDASPARCLSYPEFIDRLSDPTFATYLEPLRALLLEVAPGPGDGRWVRLTHTHRELEDLADVCRRLLLEEENQ